MSRRIPLVLAGAATAVALTCGSAARAEEIRTIVPQGPESPRRVDPLLTMTGAVLFGMPYVGSVAVAATSELAADRWLYLPVFGPIGDLVARGTCTTSGCKGTDLGSVALPLVLNAAVQAAGAGVLILSLVRPSRPPTASRRAAEVHVTPTPVTGGAGVSAFGTF